VDVAICFFVIFKIQKNMQCMAISNALARETKTWGQEVALDGNDKEIYEVMNFT